MPTAATMQTAGGNAQSGQKGGQQRAVVPMVPFIRASSQHREPCGIDVSRLLVTSGAANIGTFDVPAYGYVRSLVIVVSATGGVGASVFDADGPWSVLRDIALTEPNGAVIAQFNTGWDMMIANKYGGYRHALGADPRAAPSYAATTADGNFSFVLRVPIELSERDGLGSLPNQNAAATFKLRLSLASGAAAGGLYTTAPGTQPTVRVQAYLEAWDQPEGSMAGASNQVTPPAMNTTQFWSSQIFNVLAGENTIRLTRVGNYIRNLMFVYRAPTRVLGQANWPDPARLYLDVRPTDMVSRLLWVNTMYERTGFGARGIANEAAGGLDNGVFVYDFAHEFDGTLGRENRDLWLPTLASTRLELQGTFGAAGTLTVLTNDVAIAGNVFI